MKTVTTKLHGWTRQVLELASRLLPVAILVLIGAYVAANQAVSPHRRVIKLAVLLGLMAFMIRFDMVFSVYLFTLLFPFPSGVALGSTNSILMTLIPLIWAVRATSTKSRFFRKTDVDVPIVLLLSAYVVSCFNIDSGEVLVRSLPIMWRTLATFAYFFMIVTFVNDEKKLSTLTKVLCTACGFVMFTAVLEIFFPGATIIPGWIGLAQQTGAGSLTYRIEGIRAGGAFSSHGMLSDYGTQAFFLMVYHAYRARNPIEKTVWSAIGLMTIVAILATANRGAFFGFVIGFAYALYLFRKQIPFTRMILIVTAIVSLFLGAQIALEKYTLAASITKRLTGTEFEGIVPDTRTATWKPAIVRSLEHPFIGHGPMYRAGGSLEVLYWPHNAYIYYWYTTGFFGLAAFLFVVYRVFKYVNLYKLPEIERTRLGEFGKLFKVMLVVMLFEQLRTDHQRDDIYPYIIWMIFGMATACGLIIRARMDLKEASGDAAQG